MFDSDSVQWRSMQEVQRCTHNDAQRTVFDQRAVSDPDQGGTELCINPTIFVLLVHACTKVSFLQKPQHKCHSLLLVPIVKWSLILKTSHHIAIERILIVLSVLLYNILNYSYMQNHKKKVPM